MLKIGDKINAFSADALYKNKFIKINEKKFYKKWNVLFFYPADFTFVCPTELLDLQNYYKNFKKNNIEIYSISTDTHFAHKMWFDNSKTIKKIKYIMIGDPSHKISKMFGVLDSNTGFAQRATFVIDPNGIIKLIEINSDSIGRDAHFLLNKIKALQYTIKYPNLVCPAKWSKNNKAIKPDIKLVGKI